MLKTLWLDLIHLNGLTPKDRESRESIVSLVAVPSDEESTIAYRECTESISRVSMSQVCFISLVYHVVHGTFNFFSYHCKVYGVLTLDLRGLKFAETYLMYFLRFL